MNRIWTNAYGARRNFKQIGHQHLSNILWYNEVLVNRTRTNDHTMKQLDDELFSRYNGIRKNWKPLPIPNEIDYLFKLGLIEGSDIIWKGKKIGTIAHIKNYES
jgi:hypothetical protein